MHHFNWEVLNSTYLVQNEWLSLRADTCQMPNGVLVDPYYILESGSYVNIVPVTPDGRIVMERMYRHGCQQTMLETPGGLIDAGETPLAAGKRELLEETGYTSDRVELIGTGYPDPARMSCKAYYLLAYDVVETAKPNRELSEQMDVVLVPLPEVVAMLQDGRILDAVQQSVLFHALLRLGVMNVQPGISLP